MSGSTWRYVQCWLHAVPTPQHLHDSLERRAQLRRVREPMSGNLLLPEQYLCAAAASSSAAPAPRLCSRLRGAVRRARRLWRLLPRLLPRLFAVVTAASAPAVSGRVTSRTRPPAVAPHAEARSPRIPASSSGRLM